MSKQSFSLLPVYSAVQWCKVTKFFQCYHPHFKQSFLTHVIGKFGFAWSTRSDVIKMFLNFTVFVNFKHKT